MKADKKKTVKGKKKKKAVKKTSDEALQECEQRLRTMIDLFTEVYWEQDEKLRFSLIMHGDLKVQRELTDLFVGKYPWDFDALPINSTWDQHKKNLRARKEFNDLLLKHPTPDGQVFYYRMSAKPVFDNRGKFKGYRGVSKDVTKEVRQDQLNSLEKNVLHILTDVVDVNESLESAICVICSSEGWEAGNYWKLNEMEDALCFDVGWNIPEKKSASWIRKQAKAVTFSRGMGLPGWVWVTAEPLWVPDIMNDPRITRTDISEKTGWNSAFLFPVTAAGKVIGVLDFYAPEIREPDDGLLQVISLFGAEIGHFYQRASTLKELERYSQTFELAAVGIAYVDGNGKFILVNQRFCDMLGYSKEELDELTFQDISHPDDIHVTDEVRRKLWSGEIDSFKVEKRYLRKDGTTIWINLTSTLKRSETGNPLHGISMVEDITARKKIEQELKESEQRFRSLTELSSDWYWEQDIDFRFTRFEGRNKEFIKHLEEEFIGKHGWDGDVEVNNDEHRESMQDLMEAHTSFRDMVVQRTYPDGSRRYFNISGEPVFDAEGRFKGYRGLSRDITATKHAEERIEYLATHDVLTDLPNRTMFTRILGMTIATSKRYKRMFAVLFVDLDGFKDINDTLGHDAGDTVLRTVSKRLKACLRSSDVIARLGGDEFIILVQEINDKTNAGVVAANILSTIAEPMPYSGEEYKLTASIGICLFPEDANSEQSLINNADKAMYITKNSGKNNYHFYSETD